MDIKTVWVAMEEYGFYHETSNSGVIGVYTSKELAERKVEDFQKIEDDMFDFHDYYIEECEIESEVV